MRAFQKAGQFQLSSVTDGLLARRRHTKKSTDSCSSTSSSTTISTNAVVPSSSLPHTRRLCGNGVCRCRHAPYPPTNNQSTTPPTSSFDFSDEKLNRLIDQYPLTATIQTTTPTRYGMTLRSRATATTTTAMNGIHHEFVSPAPPPSLPAPSSSIMIVPCLNSLSSTAVMTNILPLPNLNGEKRPLTSSNQHPLASMNKKMKRSGTITIDD